jgi:predicted pyridoxine 5'-phosphate oxidase superfamily flavin-nucleotide-binding protein
MSRHFAQIAFTPAVAALQARDGSRAQYARMTAEADPDPALGPRERAFLANADSFYLATVSEAGWPYVQHRGGPRGFLRVIGPTRLAYADFRGNRQHVTAGNASGNDRVALILVDYARRQRLKVMGHLASVDADAAEPALAQAVAVPGYPARVERIATIDVVAFDWNCPQHITPRFTAAPASG